MLLPAFGPDRSDATEPGRPWCGGQTRLAVRRINVIAANFKRVHDALAHRRAAKLFAGLAMHNGQLHRTSWRYRERRRRRPASPMRPFDLSGAAPECNRAAAHALATPSTLFAPKGRARPGGGRRRPPAADTCARPIIPGRSGGIDFQFSNMANLFLPPSNRFGVPLRAPAGLGSWQRLPVRSFASRQKPSPAKL